MAQVVEKVVRKLLVGSERAEIVLFVERSERGRFGAQVAAGAKALSLAGDDDDANAVVPPDLRMRSSSIRMRTSMALRACGRARVSKPIVPAPVPAAA